MADSDTVVTGLETPAWMQRHDANPVLKPEDMPYPCKLVSNPGVIRADGQYVMAISWDAYDPGEDRLIAGLGYGTSQDGVDFEVAEYHLCPDWLAEEGVGRVYDPRLMLVEGEPYLCAAMDSDHGTCVRIARSADWIHWETVHTTTPDNRNAVLFPEAFGGRFARLERPFPMYSRGEHFDLWISFSRDMVYWGESRLLVRASDIPFCNLKMGPAAPPIRTDAGWLVLFHATDVDPARPVFGEKPGWRKRYTAGVMLLDLEDPTRVLSIGQKPVLVPETEYEMEGMVGNVVFPTAAIPEEDGTVTIYYGAADTVIARASASLEALVTCARNEG